MDILCRQLFSDAFDNSIHGTGIAVIIIAPDCLEDLLPVEYLLGLADQIGQQMHFLGSHVQLLFAHEDFHGIRIDG